MEVPPLRLTPAQLEILKIMARPMSEADLKAIKKLIVHYFATQLSQKAEKVWREKGWTEEDAYRLLHTHMRTPYINPQK